MNFMQKIKAFSVGHLLTVSYGCMFCFMHFMVRTLYYINLLINRISAPLNEAEYFTVLSRLILKAMIIIFWLERIGDELFVS